MIIQLADSFVKADIKSSSTTGAGEGKLHLGPKSDETKIDTFFNHYINIICSFDQQNLIDHIQEMKNILSEVAKVRHAKDALTQYYDELENQITAHTNFIFSLEKHIDAKRYYIRPSKNDTNGKHIWNNFFRKIPIPAYSQLKIKKNGNHFTFLLEPITATATLPIGNNISRNKIIYGAPGTGKSFKLNKDARQTFAAQRIKRVTFYNGYTYSQFVGTYKPVPAYEENNSFYYRDSTPSYTRSSNSKPYISYEYVPGILIKTLVKALNTVDSAYCLIIEELNRTKADMVFGDLFQLLDRDSSGRSEYRIKCPDDMLEHLASTLEQNVFKDIAQNGLYFPENIYIWATMNSADQGVFPMDSAFKRRWDFEYIGLNDNAQKMNGYSIDFHDSSIAKKEWNNFREKVNKLLTEEYGIAEDRLIAPFFVKAKNFNASKVLHEDVFIYKIIMYLNEDVLRHHQNTDKLFRYKNFSDLVENFNKNQPIFSDDFIDELNR